MGEKLITDKVWPDYDLIINGNDIDFVTYVRKQNKYKIWCLIPVHQRYEINKGVRGKKRESIIVDMIKRWNETCYRTLILWKFNEKKIYGFDPSFKILEEVVDITQVYEVEKLVDNWIKI